MPNSGPRVDVAPTYFSSPIACSRIARHYPSAKIVVILRNQLDLLWSQYRYALQAGSAAESFHLFIEKNPEFVGRFFFAEALKKWFEEFGRENVCILCFPDFQRDKASYLLRLCQFLEVDLTGVDQTQSYATAAKVNASDRQVVHRTAYRSIVGLGRLAERVVGRQLAWSIKRRIVDPLFLRPARESAPAVSDVADVRAIYKDDLAALKFLVKHNLEFMEIG